MPQTNTLSNTTSRKAVWFRILRIVLGVVLIWKGVNFLRDTGAVQSLPGNNVADNLVKGDAILIVMLTVITLLCGFLIIIGRFTRVASLVQLPVFLLGTLYIHGGHIERYGFELVLTIIIPFLLIILIVKNKHGLPA